MQPDEEQGRGEQTQRLIPGPLQLPPLVRGQKIGSGPYSVTVTDDMVAKRDRENQQLYRQWLNEQQRRMVPDEGAPDYTDEFKDAVVRRTFIRKVFCILSLQLLFTAAVIALFLFEESARYFMIVHWYTWIIAMVVFIISYCAISCSENARRRAPYNYICLCILTLAMSYLTAFVSAFYDIQIILMALGMTALITFTIGLLATFCKFDLTMRTGLMMILGLAFIVTIIVVTIVMMFTYIKVLHIVISVIGTLMLSMYLYFDIQTLMGGRKVELNPDEVVFATVQIYVDVVLLYQYVLMFMGLVHDN